ncbi:MAG: RNA polymerase sporulation sigma factor SigK [Lachnospiraceae bacterium]|nr:RNA polymerase sporulation sigma factor SigK [Lachnospiraceae bacterium]
MKTFLVPLSPEEEKECLARIESGEREAREDLILHNMRLVAHVVKKYAGSREDPEDLISIGTIGLLKAVGSFRADYGSRFATYAIRCIDNELLMYFRSRKKLRSEVSLFEPIGTDKEGNQIELVDVLEYQGKNAAEELYRQEQIRRIRENIGSALDEREAFIIRKRYGLTGEEEWTQRRIAAELGISRSYVSRIEKRALEKLKKIVEE